MTAAAPVGTQEVQPGAAQLDSRPAPAAVLTYANRPIVPFRASVLGRSPADRAISAHQMLDRLVEAELFGPVEARTVGDFRMIAVAGRDVFAVLPADVDTLAGETQAESAALAAEHLRTALAEVAESRRPGQLASGVVMAVAATVALALIVWGLHRARTTVGEQLTAKAMERLGRTKVGDQEFVRATRVLDYLQRAAKIVTWVLGLVAGYVWLTFVLRRFPYTRFWGETLRAALLGRLSQAGLGILAALPGLVTVALIALVTRFVIRLNNVFFHAVTDRRITIQWIHPEIADQMRKLVTAALWLFGVVMAYPYLPGSESEAFKGASVFVGLLLSLGSSGLLNQLMSGITLTYSRALRPGDFVRVGDIEGTVTQVGTLSTKIRSGRNEDVTIPNAVVVAQTVTNYSRDSEGGVFVPTEVTIGYDVPWRQVHALLLLAARRTPGIRQQPAPRVLQASLEDWYVRYVLLCCFERPSERRLTLAALHEHVLDAFNEYGVQITSPNYEADPSTPKVVARDQWFAAPAPPDPDVRR